MEPTDPRSTLLELAGEHGVSLSRLSRLVGKNPSYLQQFVRKGSPRKLEESDRRTLARFFGVDETRLGAPQEISFTESREGDWIDIPRLAQEASAGPGTWPAVEGEFASFRWSGRWLREMGLEASQLSMIAVSGDSMIPILADGDEILVDRTHRALRDGIHVVRLGDALHVKRVQQLGPGRVKLISENPVYPPVELTADEIEIIGRVVWKGGRL